MTSDHTIDLESAVEDHFSHLEFASNSLESFKEMLNAVNNNTEYRQQFLAFDIRSGLREHLNSHGEENNTTSHMLRNPGEFATLVKSKVAALKDAGLMDQLSIALLVDSCGMSGSYARRTAKGHSAELLIHFSGAINNAIQRKDIEPQFIIDVIKLELIRDTPFSIIKQANLSEDEMIDFAIGTRRQDVLRLLSNKAKREVLGNDLGM
jgi:hypothetical protein